jgi:hypothetical protein
VRAPIVPSLLLAAWLGACAASPAVGGSGGAGGTGGPAAPGGSGGGGGAGGSGGGGAGGSGGSGGGGGSGGTGGSGGCSTDHPEEFEVTALEPDEGVVGDAVIIRGHAFDPRVECNEVHFYGVVSTDVAVLDTSTLRAVVPAFAMTGPVTVRRGGWTTAVGPTFTVLGPSRPRIDRVTPDRISAGSPATEVRIDGADFDPDVEVTLDRIPLQLLEATAASLRVLVPAELLATPHRGDLAVSNAGIHFADASIDIAQDLRIVRALATGPREVLAIFDSVPPAPGLQPEHVGFDPPLGVATIGTCPASWGAGCFRIETVDEQVRGATYALAVTGLAGNFGGVSVGPPARFRGYGSAPELVATVSAAGCGASGLAGPVGFGRWAGRVIVVEREGRQLQLLDADGFGPFWGYDGVAAGWHAGDETAAGCGGSAVPADPAALRSPRGAVGFGRSYGLRLYATDTGEEELFSLTRPPDAWDDPTAFDELASTRLASSPVLLAVLPGTRVDGIFLADASDRLALVDPRGIRLATAAGPGSGQGQVSLGVADGASPNAVLITPANRLYLADTGNHRVQVFDDGLQFLYWLGAGTNGFSFGPCCAASTEPGGFTRPRSIAYDDGATLFVGDEVGGGRVQRFDLAGTWLSTLELGFVPTAMIVDQQGALWIADEAGNAVHRFLP